ncbi:alpha-glucosidase [Puteibacter caeruleilacunae]|nr:alpha-glucosidase [Puteibacter caeruleilacunae]
MDKISLSSPNGAVQVDLSVVNSQFLYKVTRSGEALIADSKLSIFDNVAVTVLDYQVKENDSSWEPVWGQFSNIRDNYKEATVDFKSNNFTGKLLIRAYDDGVAYRFVLPEGDKSGEVNLYCEYNFAEDFDIFMPKGEQEPLGPIKVESLLNLKGKKNKPAQLKVPIVAETAKHSFFSLIESDLYTATDFQIMNLSVNPSTKTLYSSNKSKLTNAEMITPWRVILFGDQPGDMVVSTTPVNLAAPCKLEDTDWIKPGKTLWDWRVHGYTAEDGFVYGINTESYKRFIDFAAEYDIEYFLIDDSWYTHASKGHFELSDKLNLKEVIDYAKAKDVDLMLYYDRRHGEYGDEGLFKYYANELEMKGMKYGFMNTNVPFTKNAIEQSAVNHLLIDFHDGPVPFTGIRRTLPNAVTREYCHAQQDSRRAFTPESFIKMALINAITGTLDMNNGNFDITGINSGKRQKGPRKLNSYPTTVTSEVARTLVIFSGLVCIPDAPEAYAAKKDLFEFIQKMPVGKWDESKILHSKMGEYITTARRHDKEWYIGSVYCQKGGSLDINLDFLEEGVEYDVTYYEDTPDTHCLKNPEAYNVRKGKVKKGDVIKAVMAPGGGHCMWIHPVI